MIFGHFILWQLNSEWGQGTGFKKQQPSAAFAVEGCIGSKILGLRLRQPCGGCQPAPEGSSPSGPKKCQHQKVPAAKRYIKSQISSARHTVIRGPNFMGFGKRPFLTPSHHVDFPIGKISRICLRRKNPVLGISFTTFPP